MFKLNLIDLSHNFYQKTKMTAVFSNESHSFYLFFFHCAQYLFCRFEHLFVLATLQPETFASSSNVTLSVRMIETHWRLPRGEFASRDIFMTALQNITHIFLRGASSVAFTSLT